MINFKYILHDSLNKVNKALEHYFCIFANQKKTPLIKAMRHSILLGGKRIRPFLVYNTGRMFGVKTASLNAPAAAIECIHAYSLIHDDLPSMDDDIIRRGLPSCHIKFGEKIAILAGDALQTMAFSILANAYMPKVSLQNRLQMISILASASGAKGMCLGQSLDLTSREKKISIMELKKIHKYKTGTLIRAAVKMGALAKCQHDNPVIKYLDLFATAIGLAFQAQDDIIDVIKDSKDNDKEQKINKKKDGKKNTYPNLLGMDIAQNKTKELYNKSLIYLKYISKLGYNTTNLAELSRYIIERHN